MRNRALLLISIFWHVVYAQPVITESNAPRIGDIAIYAIDTLPDPSFNMNTGANIQWNIQNADIDLLDTIRYVDPTTTGFDTSAVVSSSDYAIELGKSTYIFVKRVRGSVNADVSVAISGRNPNDGEVFLAIALDPDTLALFPITYPDVFADTGVYRTYYDTVILGSTQQIPVDITVIHFDSVDAFGTMTLPTGHSFDVIRIKRRLKIKVEANFAGFTLFSDSVESIEIHFVTDDTSYHYSIVSASINTNNQDSLNNLSIISDFVLSTEKSNLKPKFVILQNNNQISIYASEEVIVDILDLSGKSIFKSKGTIINLPLNHNTINGIQIIRIIDSSGNVYNLKI